MARSQDPDQAIYGPPLASSEDSDESMNRHPGTRGRPRKHPVSEPRTPPPAERQRAPKQKYVASPSSRQTRSATSTAPPLARGAAYRPTHPRKPSGTAGKPNKAPGRGRVRPRKSDDTAHGPRKAAGKGGRGGSWSASRRKSPSPSPSDREESRPDDSPTSGGTSLDSIFRDHDLEASTSVRRRPKGGLKTYGRSRILKRRDTPPATGESVAGPAYADDDYSMLPPDPGEGGLGALPSSAARSKGKEKLREAEPRRPPPAKLRRPEVLGEDAAEAHEDPAPASQSARTSPVRNPSKRPKRARSESDSNDTEAVAEQAGVEERSVHYWKKSLGVIESVAQMTFPDPDMHDFLPRRARQLFFQLLARNIESPENFEVFTPTVARRRVAPSPYSNYTCFGKSDEVSPYPQARAPSGGTGPKPPRRSAADIQKALKEEEDRYYKIQENFFSATRRSLIIGDAPIPTDPGFWESAAALATKMRDQKVKMERYTSELRERLGMLREASADEHAIDEMAERIREEGLLEDQLVSSGFVDLVVRANEALFGNADNLRRISPGVLAAFRNTELEAYKAGRGPAGQSPSGSIGDSEPGPTVLETELQKENEALREQLEQLRLSNQQEIARREITPTSQPARAAEELERQNAELAARNAEFVERDTQLRRLIDAASEEKTALEAEVGRLRQQSEQSAARARDAATARDDFERRYKQAQQDLDTYDARLRQGIEQSREIADHIAKEKELRAAWIKEADGHTETKHQLREAKEKISAQGEALRGADETRERLREAESRLIEKEFSLAQALRQLEALGITAEGLRELRLRLRRAEPPSRRVPLLELQVQQLNGQLRDAAASSGALAQSLKAREAELSESKAKLDESLKREEALVAEVKKVNAEHSRALGALESTLSDLRNEVANKSGAIDQLQEANRQLQENEGKLEANARALTEDLRQESAKVQTLQAELVTERDNVSSRDGDLASLRGELRSERENVNALEGAKSMLQTGISTFLTRAFGSGPPAGWPSLLQDISRDAPAIGGGAAAAGLDPHQIWVVETPWRAATDPVAAVRPTAEEQVMQLVGAIRDSASLDRYPRAVFDVFAAVVRGLREPERPSAAAYLAKSHLRDAILQTCTGKDPHEQCLLMFAYRELNLRAQALFGEDTEDPVVHDLHKGFRTRGADLLAHLDEVLCAVDRRDQGAVAGRLALSCGDRLRVIGDFALLADVGPGDFMLLDLRRRTIRTIEKSLASEVDHGHYIGPVRLVIRSPRPAEWQAVVFENPHWRVEAWWRKFMDTYD
ncbi:hypothetical protein DL771_003897 [Monosporascus sp. 5C6A]|nr:hypothetical protein DL771_003897 [Monosporascus sp. 5C6A]